MRWAIVKSSLSTIRATVGSCDCGEMTASSSDASGSRLRKRTWRLGALRVLSARPGSRVSVGHVLRVLVSAKWREHLSKVWRRTAGGIRLTRRHPNRLQATSIAAGSTSPYLSEYDVRYSHRFALATADAMRADKALRASAGSG